MGYITNYIGVKMLFYPHQYFGFSWLRWDQQPFGLLGWQGLVPAKRFIKAATLIDLDTTKGIDIPDVFSRLDTKVLSKLLTGSISNSLFYGLVPNPIFNLFLRKAARNVINNIEHIADFRQIAINGLTYDPAILGNFFQKIASKEIGFLINSGLGFGFILGIA